MQQKYPLTFAATTIAYAMAGVETGTLANFDPNNSAAWQGQAQRNNNPGNLRGVNLAMNKYATPADGFAAMVADITNKIRGHTVTKIRPSSSITDLINVWAPVGENSQASVDNYVSFVSGQVGAALGQSDITQSDGTTIGIADAPFNSYIEV